MATLLMEGAQEMDTRLLLRPEEAAERLAIGRTQLYSLLLRGEIKSISFGKSRRIAPEDLVAFVQRKRVCDGQGDDGQAA
jgi:excisionase family DNA binding protein